MSLSIPPPAPGWCLPLTVHIEVSLLGKSEEKTQRGRGRKTSTTYLIGLEDYGSISRKAFRTVSCTGLPLLLL